MPTKSQIPWFLATLVFVAYSHCVFAHAREAADRHHQLQAADQPLDNTRATCENESACICKGVTLAVGIEAASPELGLVHLARVDSAAERLHCVADSSDRRPLPDDGMTPTSGRNLRAQLQRFLL